MPFAEYDSFEECVSRNKDKDDPEAYCASIHKKATGKWPTEKMMKCSHDKIQKAMATLKEMSRA